nr:NlpC/P60 family protein [Methylocucumis oryzae]
MQKYKTTSHLLLLALCGLISACSSTPETETVVKPIPSRQPKAVAYALTLQGTPYRYGKDNPREGFDCSGFVRHVYSTQGVRLPRTAKEMALACPLYRNMPCNQGTWCFLIPTVKSFPM